ncbi:unnamed protein product [Amoebophrya sp. A120]|nr:unnamed protein product [Amoebophrya sp. A120]|eukprot:GSA120T00006583001.1
MATVSVSTGTGPGTVDTTTASKSRLEKLRQWQAQRKKKNELRPRFSPEGRSVAPEIRGDDACGGAGKSGPSERKVSFLSTKEEKGTIFRTRPLQSAAAKSPRFPPRSSFDAAASLQNKGGSSSNGPGAACRERTIQGTGSSLFREQELARLAQVPQPSFSYTGSKCVVASPPKNVQDRVEEPSSGSTLLDIKSHLEETKPSLASVAARNLASASFRRGAPARSTASGGAERVSLIGGTSKKVPRLNLGTERNQEQDPSSPDEKFRTPIESARPENYFHGDLAAPRWRDDRSASSASRRLTDLLADSRAASGAGYPSRKVSGRSSAAGLQPTGANLVVSSSCSSSSSTSRPHFNASTSGVVPPSRSSYINATTGSGAAPALWSSRSLSPRVMQRGSTRSLSPRDFSSKIGGCSSSSTMAHLLSGRGSSAWTSSSRTRNTATRTSMGDMINKPTSCSSSSCSNGFRSVSYKTGGGSSVGGPRRPTLSSFSGSRYGLSPKFSSSSRSAFDGTRKVDAVSASFALTANTYASMRPSSSLDRLYGTSSHSAPTSPRAELSEFVDQRAQQRRLWDLEWKLEQAKREADSMKRERTTLVQDQDRSMQSLRTSEHEAKRALQLEVEELRKKLRMAESTSAGRSGTSSASKLAAEVRELRSELRQREREAQQQRQAYESELQLVDQTSNERLQKLQEQLTTLRTDNTQLQTELQQYKTELRQTETDMDSAESEVQLLRKQVTDLNASIVVQQQQQQHVSKKDGVTGESEDQQVLFDEAVKDLEEREQELSKERAFLEEHSAALEGERAELVRERAEFLQELSAFEQECSKQEDMSNNLNVLSELEEKVDTHVAAEEERQKQVLIIEALQEQLREANAVRRAQTVQLLSVKSSLQIFCRVRPHRNHALFEEKRTPKSSPRVQERWKTLLGDRKLSSPALGVHQAHQHPFSYTNGMTATEAARASSLERGSASVLSFGHEAAGAAGGACSKGLKTVYLHDGSRGCGGTNGTTSSSSSGRVGSPLGGTPGRGQLKVSSSSSSNKHAFACFDQVFGCESQNSDVFESVQATVEGCIVKNAKASIFCYGPSGSGKTHTMLGSAKDPGVAVRAVRLLYGHPDFAASLHSFSLVCVEVDCTADGNAPLAGTAGFGGGVAPSSSSSSTRFGAGASRQASPRDHHAGGTRTTLVDLLTGTTVEMSQNFVVHKNSSSQQPVQLSPDPAVYPKSEQEAVDYLALACHRRKTLATKTNVFGSSRSHAVFQLRFAAPGGGVLNLVDLAGCERSAAAGAGDIETEHTISAPVQGMLSNSNANAAKLDMKTTIAINSSLSVLARCFRTVAREHSAAIAPVRESVLTFLLQDCFKQPGSASGQLSNRSFVSLILCLAPEEKNRSDTKHALQFASHCSVK